MRCQVSGSGQKDGVEVARTGHLSPLFIGLLVGFGGGKGGEPGIAI